MKRFLFALTALVCGLTQAQEPYQVPGFPPFAPAPQMLEVVEDRGDKVLVRHAQGETEMPKNPQRIVATDAAALEMLLSLGLEPVGAMTFAKPAGVVRDMAEGVTLLPVVDGVNLEAVLALEPDLIVGWYNTDNYAQLSRIAPTLEFMGNSATYWRRATLDFAEVLGKRELAQRVIGDYGARSEATRTRLDEIMGDSSVTVIRALPGEGLSLNPPGYEGSAFGQAEGYIPYQPTRWLYEDLRRLPGPEVHAMPLDAGRQPFSAEFLPELQANYLVVLLPNPEHRRIYEEFTRNTQLWQRVPAVANDQLIVLDIGNYDGYHSNLYIIKAFTDALTGGTPD